MPVPIAQAASESESANHWHGATGSLPVSIVSDSESAESAPGLSASVSVRGRINHDDVHTVSKVQQSFKNAVTLSLAATDSP